MTEFLGFLQRHYSFHWFLDTWSVKEKCMYVALYVVLYKISLIPILVLFEKCDLLSEGSLLSLGVLVIVFVFWFAIYQPAFNFFMTRQDN